MTDNNASHPEPTKALVVSDLKDLRVGERTGALYYKGERMATAEDIRNLAAQVEHLKQTLAEKGLLSHPLSKPASP